MVLISVIAYQNLRNIFNAQKDFVIGSLFSLTGFCFAKALTRDRGEQALEILRDTGAFEQVALIDRNVKAAAERLTDYHDLQCRELEFYRNSALLRISLDDLDKTITNIADLRRTLGIPPGQVYPIGPDVRLSLISVRRCVHEGLNRRDQAYEWLLPRMPSQDREAWDLFSVLTADIQKSSLTLDSLLSQYVEFPPNEYVRTILGYLRAALRRCELFRQTAGTTPRIFTVLEEDLQHAIEDLEDVDLRLRSNVVPGPSPVPAP
ncbi:hypothetical protein ACIPSA_17100 [Streptomyces sp. NPDC086549]|uniref:hypothetical protein n=1 Tax=Streptomyces sp. NPDC086549 TaxID=3365752 RepID=UPI00380D021C